MIREIGVKLAVALALVLANGCTTYSTSFMVGTRTRQYGVQMEPPQFYKLDLYGLTLFQRTQFQCGWYDKDAVDKLFSEVVVETSNQNTASGGAKAPTDATTQLQPEKPDEKAFLVFGPEGQTINPSNRRFVMIAANNPKAIVDQIDAFSSDQDVAKAMTALMQSSARQALLGAQHAAARDEVARAALKAEISRVQGDLPKPGEALDASWTQSRVSRLVDELVRAIPLGK